MKRTSATSPAVDGLRLGGGSGRQQHFHSFQFVRPLAKLRRLHLGIEFRTARCTVAHVRAELWNIMGDERQSHGTAGTDCRLNVVICQTAVSCCHADVASSDDSHQTILLASTVRQRREEFLPRDAAMLAPS